MALSKGKVYKQTTKVATYDLPAQMDSCVFPIKEQLQVLVEYVKKYMYTIVSIGCGQGYLEGLLQNEGVSVIGVDLDFLPNQDNYRLMPCYCGEIRRVHSHELFFVSQPEKCCLLFCFGRRLPLWKYLNWYHQCKSVVIIGDETSETNGSVATPPCDALQNSSEWEVVIQQVVRARMEVKMIIYERIHSSDADSILFDEL